MKQHRQKSTIVAKLGEFKRPCVQKRKKERQKNHTEGSELQVIQVIQVIHTGLSVSKLQDSCVTISDAKFGTTIAHRQFMSEITPTS